MERLLQNNPARRRDVFWAKSRTARPQLPNGKHVAAARTVNQVADKWLVDFVDQFKKPKTAVEYRRIVDLHIRPALGKAIMREVARADVATLRSGMRATPIMANRALAVFGSLWAFASRVGDVDADFQSGERRREIP